MRYNTIQATIPLPINHVLFFSEFPSQSKMFLSSSKQFGEMQTFNHSNLLSKVKKSMRKKCNYLKIQTIDGLRNNILFQHIKLHINQKH